MFCKDCKLVFFSKRKPHQHKCLAQFGKLVTRNLRFKCKSCTSKHTGACIREVFERGVTSQKKKTIETHRCFVCSKPFSLKGNLSRHLRTHFGQEPFSCENCSITFLQKSNLKRHCRTHESSSKKTFICKVCSKTFANKYNLSRHKQSLHESEQMGVFFEESEQSDNLPNRSKKKEWENIKLALSNIVVTGDTWPKIVPCIGPLQQI